VVGASVAGVATAEALRRHGFDGSLIVLGAETHRPYDRPPLTKAVLAGDAHAADCALRPDDRYEELDVDLRLGAVAVGLDLRERMVALQSGDRLSFDSLAVTTGATPRTLPGPPLRGVFTVRTLDDALALRAAIAPGAKVVVVGGGFIGAEVAATATRLGAAVTIVEAAPAPLAAALGTEVGGVLAEIHTGEGVAVRCGLPVAGLEGDDRVRRVLLADGTALDADVVVVGLGARPATEWLRGSGVDVDDGILCDAFCRAAAPGVVAAGDVARWRHPRHGPLRIEHWENAVTQGQAAARAILGVNPTEPYQPVPYVWSDQYRYKLQLVGVPRPGDRLVVIDGTLRERRFVALYVRGDQVTAAVGVGRPRAVMGIRRLLGEPVTVAEIIDALAGGEPSSNRTPPNDGLTNGSAPATIPRRISA
jgi:NADPH-dependent 2,4-dienoyl-CoA reductase/sulfur reductase-like enzyme